MANTIKLKRSSVPGKAPLSANLDYGELSINYTDGTLYYKNSSGTISTIGSNIGNTVISGNITATTASTRASFANVITTNGVFWSNGSAYGTGGFDANVTKIAIGYQAGINTQGAQTVAIGESAGFTTQCAGAVAIGANAGRCSQNSDAVAVGNNAGKICQGCYSVAVGRYAGRTSQGYSAIAIGTTAGNVSQGVSSIAIGTGAGGTSQGAQAVAIGGHAGCAGQSASAVAIGACAAATSQGGSAVAIGAGAGNCSQGGSAIAVGNSSGNNQQGQYGIAIGYLSGHCAQGSGAVAIGRCAGFGCQQTNAVAIGYNAGQYSQGACAVAIGRNAGVTNQVTHSIVINASGNVLDPANSGFYVDPIRSATGSNVVVYNTTTKELTYTTLPSSYTNSNVEAYIGANIGAYQTYANGAIQTLSANIGTLIAGAPGALDTLYEIDQALGNNASFSATMVTWLGNITTNVTTANTSISTLNANLGAFQTYANANIGTLFNGNASTNANLGAFQTYANAKIGTNTNSNLVVVSTTPSTTATTGALVVAGGVGVSGNIVVGGTNSNVLIGYTAVTSTSAGSNFAVAGNVSIGGNNASNRLTITTGGQGTDGIHLIGGGGSNQFVDIRPNSGAGNNNATVQAGDQSIIYSGGTVNTGALVIAPWNNVAGGGLRMDNSGNVTIVSNVILGSSTTSNVVVAATTTSTSNVTGALVSKGGIASNGGLVVDGGSVQFNNNYAATDPAGYDAKQFITMNNWTNISGVSYSPTDPRIFAMGMGPSNRFFLRTVQPMELVASNVFVNAATTSHAGSIIPTANLTYNIGSTTAWWNIVYGKSVQAQYADLAEIYTADYKYQAGTVVVFGGTAEVTTTSISHDTRAAGVVSTDPAYLMNSVAEGIPVAMTGRVPCQVRGPVTKGTVLVTSNTPGVAEAIDYDLYRPGAVLGKSLGEIPDSTIRTIEVVVGRF